MAKVRKVDVPEPRHGSLNYDTNAVGDETGLHCFDESLTVQSQAQDADINVIMKRYGVTGSVPVVAMPPTFGDFEGISDYREAMDLINAAERSFMSLNADVRARFGNDPQRFLEFCSAEQDGKLVNIDEMRKIGLAVPEVAPEPKKFVDATFDEVKSVFNPVFTEAKPK